MPSNKSYNNTSSSSGGNDRSYEVTGRGVNSQGNSYDTRTDSGGSAYHYSNNNGSYYYQNSNGSTYYNSGPERDGGSTYTAPNGWTVKK